MTKDLTSPRLSLVVNTLNSDRTLERCLTSAASVVDEIVIVDMSSDDRTQEIARRFTCRVYTHERLGYVEPARNFAIEQTTGDWILILDADEYLSPSLAQGLRAVITEPHGVDVFLVPFETYIAGRWLKGTGWGRCYEHHHRLFRRGSLRWTSAIHSAPEIYGATGILPMPVDAVIMHENYLSLRDFVDRMNRYTDLEAKGLKEQGQHWSPGAVAEAVRREIDRRYHPEIDGTHSLVLSIGMAFYRFLSWAKLWEIEGCPQTGLPRQSRDLFQWMAEPSQPGVSWLTQEDVESSLARGCGESYVPEPSSDDIVRARTAYEERLASVAKDCEYRIAECESRLAEVERRWSQRFADVQASWSWRLTGPLRFLGRLPPLVGFRPAWRPVSTNTQGQSADPAGERHGVLPPPAYDRSSSLAVRQFGGFQVAHRVGTADEKVITHSFDKDIFFTGMPEYRPEPGHTILDVGAHIGTFSMLAGRRVSPGKVHAVEASHDSYNLLRINIALNYLTNVVAHHLALSDSAGQATLYHDTGNWGHSIVKRMSDKSETVRADTLQHFMDANGIETCDFAKFNCEGAEFPILLSASDSTIGRFRSMLVLYHCHLAEGTRPEQIMDRLRSCAFNVRLTNQSEHAGWIAAYR